MLKGLPQLQRRLKAVAKVGETISRDWADDTEDLARARVRVRSGRTRASIGRRAVSRDEASVQAAFGARYLEKGTRAHEIKPVKVRALKFTAGAGPIFAKKVHHPPTAARPFLHVSGEEAIQRAKLNEKAVTLWNKAA